MDRDVAQMIATTAARCAQEVGNLAPLVRQHCNDEEYEKLSQAIGSSVYELMEGLMGAVFKMFPELEAEAKDRLERYGRSYF